MPRANGGGLSGVGVSSLIVRVFAYAPVLRAILNPTIKIDTKRAYARCAASEFPLVKG